MYKHVVAAWFSEPTTETILRKPATKARRPKTGGADTNGSNNGSGGVGEGQTSGADTNGSNNDSGGVGAGQTGGADTNGNNNDSGGLGHTDAACSSVNRAVAANLLSRLSHKSEHHRTTAISSIMADLGCTTVSNSVLERAEEIIEQLDMANEGKKGEGAVNIHYRATPNQRASSSQQGDVDSQLDSTKRVCVNPAPGSANSTSSNDSNATVCDSDTEEEEGNPRNLEQDLDFALGTEQKRGPI